MLEMVEKKSSSKATQDHQEARGVPLIKKSGYSKEHWVLFSLVMLTNT